MTSRPPSLYCKGDKLLIATLILAIGTATVWLALACLIAVGTFALAAIIYATALVAVLIRNLFSKGRS